MARNGGVTVIGLPALQAALATKAALMRAAATAAVAAEVDKIRGDAVAEAPRGATGDLASGIDGEANGTMGQVRANARHSLFQEFGTSRHGAQPYMTPAAQKARSRFVGRVSGAIRKAVD